MNCGCPLDRQAARWRPQSRRRSFLVWKAGRPNGGKAAEQASASASAEAYNKRHNPQVGDCVKVTGLEDDNTLQMTIVGCDSSEAQYKTAEVLTGAQECKPDTARAISLRGRHTVSTRWCFTTV
ncbi:LppU/SCO3897 family protein [Streptomyces lydicus]